MSLPSQKYSLVSLLEPVKAGKIFSWKDWVLHITFAGIHFAEWDSEMISEFESLMCEINSFKADTLAEDKIGNFEVILVDKSISIVELHNSVIDFLEKHNALFNNPEWNRDGYIPHSTIQKHAKASRNSIIKIDNLALVDRFPGGDGRMRKIVKVFDLKTAT